MSRGTGPSPPGRRSGPGEEPRRLEAAVAAATLLATVLAAAGTAGPLAAQEDNRTWLFGDVSFPARVDSFTVMGTERWSEPDRGTLLRYRTGLAPDATVDVHVQPLPGGRSDPQAIREEFQSTLDDLREYAGRGVSLTVDTVHAMAVEARGWTYEGHAASATVRRGGVTGRSLALVFAKPPSFVTFRITHDAGLRSVLDPRIRAFVAGILARIESFQDRRPEGGG